VGTRTDDIWGLGVGNAEQDRESAWASHFDGKTWTNYRFPGLYMLTAAFAASEGNIYALAVPLGGDWSSEVAWFSARPLGTQLLIRPAR
jgi:hypothetical protein